MRIFIFALLMFVSLPAVAQDAINTDLAEDHVDITTGFNGSSVTVFGVKEGPGEIAVVLRGPGREMTVRRKEETGGAWMNRDWMNFESVPIYYDYAVSVPEEKLASVETLRAGHIGLGAGDLKTDDGAGAEEQKNFREALIRNRQKAGLFTVKAKKVNFISDNFFRVNFTLPANVHPGVYTVETYYFDGGKVAGIKTSKLRVAHVGTNAKVLEFAQEHALSYGFLVVLLAMFAGWFSNRIRSRR